MDLRSVQLHPQNEQRVSTRPNILIVMCDQLGAGALPAYGHPVVKAPNIDALATRGTVFNHCYSSFPLCVPARLAFMTGKRCSNVAAWDNAAQLAPDIPTFRQVGYTSNIIPSTFGVFAPMGTPKAIIDKVNKGIVKVASNEEFQKRHMIPRGLQAVLNTPE